jgi:hypothetical protein
MLIWNSYSNFELDHSAREVQLVFRNAANTVISTTNLSLPEATESELTPYVANFPVVSGVKQVDLVVHTLWGGNEISMRRLAFAGSTQTAGIARRSTNQPR